MKWNGLQESLKYTVSINLGANIYLDVIYSMHVVVGL